MRKEVWVCDRCGFATDGPQREFKSLNLVRDGGEESLNLCTNCMWQFRGWWNKLSAAEEKAESGAVGADVKAKTTPVPAAPPATTALSHDEQVRKQLEDSFWTPTEHKSNVSYKSVMQLEREEIPSGAPGKARRIGDYNYWRTDTWCYREKVKP